MQPLTSALMIFVLQNMPHLQYFNSFISTCLSAMPCRWVHSALDGTYESSYSMKITVMTAGKSSRLFWLSSVISYFWVAFRSPFVPGSYYCLSIYCFADKLWYYNVTWGNSVIARVSIFYLWIRPNRDITHCNKLLWCGMKCDTYGNCLSLQQRTILNLCVLIFWYQTL